MNQVIETILQHRSIRKFEDRPLSDEQIRTQHLAPCLETVNSH
jgi:nitroreductase